MKTALLVLRNNNPYLHLTAAKLIDCSAAAERSKSHFTQHRAQLQILPVTTLASVHM